MNISLQSYIEQALLEITSGVETARGKSQIPIAPGFVGGTVQPEPQMIEFTIQVAVSETKSKTGKGDVSLPVINVLKAGVGGELGSENQHSTTQTIKFSVPVYFQGKMSPNE